MNKEVAIIFKAYDQTQREMGQIGRGLDRLKRQLIGFGAGYLSARAIVAGLKSITTAAMEAEESENLFTVALGENAAAARSWSETYASSLGLSETATRKTMGTFYAMFESMQVGQSDALKMSQSLTQLANDMASFYNLRTDEAFTKIQAGISGEVEPLKRLGIIINETTIKEYALRQGWIKQGEQLSELGKVYARIGVLSEQTEKAQGDMARTADSATNTLRTLGETWRDISADIGKSFVEPLRDTAADFKEWLTDHKEDLATWADVTVKTVTTILRAYAGLYNIGKSFWEYPDKARQSMEYYKGKEPGVDAQIWQYQETLQRMARNSPGAGGIWAESLPTGPIGPRVDPMLQAIEAEQAAMQKSVESLRGMEIGEPLAPPPGTAAKGGGASAMGDATAKAREQVSRLNDELDREFDIIGRLGDSHERAAKMVDYERAVREAYGDDLAMQTTLMENYETQLRALERHEKLVRMAEQMGESFASAFDDMVLGARSASEAMRALAMDVARLIMRQTVTQPLADFISAGITGAFSAGRGQKGVKVEPGMEMGQLSAASRLHAGGIVGPSNPTTMVPAGIFAGAPRLHGGLMADEFPAILQRGEEVVPKGGGSRPIEIQFVDQSGKGVALRAEQREESERTVVEVFARDRLRRGPLTAGMR